MKYRKLIKKVPINIAAKLAPCAVIPTPRTCPDPEYTEKDINIVSKGENPA